MHSLELRPDSDGELKVDPCVGLHPSRDVHDSRKDECTEKFGDEGKEAESRHEGSGRVSATSTTIVMEENSLLLGV
jgi:hypothetical protein